ncbi:hypothetical protein G7Z17_g2961 [Cylindrodendrum hubeiense]|uniref:Uncharacterized protein n=1 Tax=Cylindrodendrum hubeiense TaxID=595255 RepID=A0A9P5LIL7_9HYPO|nr:hypothetical protein G7Z17_g2961 [Cylindrodendrum hubeiense]
MAKKNTRSTPSAATSSQDNTMEEATTSTIQDDQPATAVTNSPTTDPRFNEEEELDRRIEILQREHRIQRKRKWLELIEAGKEPTFDSCRENTEARPTVLRRSDEEDDDPQSPRTGWEPPLLRNPRYSGKSWMELQMYLMDLNSIFLLQPQFFKHGLHRMLYASSWLEGHVKQRWIFYVINDRGGNLKDITWQDFEVWVRGDNQRYHCQPPRRLGASGAVTETHQAKRTRLM